MSQHDQVCGSPDPQRIVLVVHSREPLGPSGANQLDQNGRLQLVHSGVLGGEANDVSMATHFSVRVRRIWFAQRNAANGTGDANPGGA